MADHETMRERLLQTFELFEFGVEMMASNLRRKHPEANPAAIEEMLEQWLAAEPAASDGEESEIQGVHSSGPTDRADRAVAVAAARRGIRNLARSGRRGCGAFA